MGPEQLQGLVRDMVQLSHRIRLLNSRSWRELEDLTVEQCFLLCFIDKNGGEITISHLAGIVSRASHTVTALVDTLERRGLVTRQRKPTADRRQVWVSLTSRGRAALEDFRRWLPTHFPELFGNRSDQDLEEISRAVATLARFLGDQRGSQG